MALVKCSFSSWSSGIRIPKQTKRGRTIPLPLGFLAGTKQFPCLLCATDTQKGCSNSARVIFSGGLFSVHAGNGQCQTVDRADALRSQSFCKSLWYSPTTTRHPDTDALSFLRWALGQILNYGQACAFSCVTKAQASTIAHLIFISFSFLLGKGVTAVFTIILLFLET